MVQFANRMHDFKFIRFHVGVAGNVLSGVLRSRRLETKYTRPLCSYRIANIVWELNYNAWNVNNAEIADIIWMIYCLAVITSFRL